jgi:hypothetical protein
MFIDCCSRDDSEAYDLYPLPRELFLPQRRPHSLGHPAASVAILLEDKRPLRNPCG